MKGAILQVEAKNDGALFPRLLVGLRGRTWAFREGVKQTPLSSQKSIRHGMSKGAISPPIPLIDPVKSRRNGRLRKSVVSPGAHSPLNPRPTGLTLTIDRLLRHTHRHPQQIRLGMQIDTSTALPERGDEATCLSDQLTNAATQRVLTRAILSNMWFTNATPETTATTQVEAASRSDVKSNFEQVNARYGRQRYLMCIDRLRVVQHEMELHRSLRRIGAAPSDPIGRLVLSSDFTKYPLVRVSVLRTVVFNVVFDLGKYCHNGSVRGRFTRPLLHAASLFSERADARIRRELHHSSKSQYHITRANGAAVHSR